MMDAESAELVVALIHNYQQQASHPPRHLGLGCRKSEMLITHITGVWCHLNAPIYYQITKMFTSQNKMLLTRSWLLEGWITLSDR